MGSEILSIDVLDDNGMSDGEAPWIDGMVKSPLVLLWIVNNLQCTVDARLDRPHRIKD